ncbi:MAG: LysR family transcriptional regulator [Oscillospiraceae bacterium]|nr:LysR family transcriptional regulator [Oscillospiraceae bacterium]
MTDRQLRYILAIAKEGNISAAAQKLFISQPSLSSLVAHVEEELGAKLFDRSVSPMIPTYVGEKYIESAESILSTLEDLNNLVTDIDSSRSGRLRIGCGPQHSPFVIPLLLPQIMTLYPGVDFHITEDSRAVLENELLAGRLDLLLYGGHSDNPTLCYEELAAQEYILLVPKGAAAATLPAQEGRALPVVNLCCLKHCNFVLMKRGHGLRAMQDLIFSELGFFPNIILETDNWQTSIRLVESGIACTVLPDADSGMFGQAFDKYALEKRFDRHIWLCYRQNAYIPKVMKDLIAMVRRLFLESL